MTEFQLCGHRAAFTNREGGTSAILTTANDPAYGVFNLGDHVGDSPQRVQANREALEDWAQVPIAWMNQVHGDHIAVFAPPHAPTQTPVTADALVANGYAAAVMVADCLPILLASWDHQWVAAIHAGRKGCELDIVTKCANKIRSLAPGRLVAAIGPAICARHYEVDQQTYKNFVSRWPQGKAQTPQGTPALDLRAVVKAQLAQAQIEVAYDFDICTYRDAKSYSYRRDGVTGRFCGIIVS
ncbi:hypothetical protein BK816_05645 [Boudabousia tangfeifanii]|uniref:Purine nucleoside phosphorylase n=1 Tax=Boudabousia tangfeifanii TaxID=1912795 RepID=A0A1D9MKN8_9ACTO|nr:polyphenol oxidase family protein [Boudabousia tangfeifanii]AOZ72842.1 hypothetical protein BK816_05645 [Boudabousia tangfeifanii]